MSLSRAQLRRFANGSRREKAIYTLMESPQRVLATILLGNLFVNTLMTALMAAFMARLFSGDHGLNQRLIQPLAQWCGIAFKSEAGWENFNNLCVAAINVAVVTPVVILLGELVPKANAYQNNLSFAKMAARPLLFFARCTTPLLWLLRLTTDFLMRVLMLNPARGEWSMLTADEVAADINAGTATGAASTVERDLLARIIRFGGMEAKEIMVPRTEIIGIDDRLTLAEAFAIIRESTHNYLPIYHDTIDEIWGVISFQDALRWRNLSPKTPLAEYRSHLEGCDPTALRPQLPVQPIQFIPESAPIDRVLTEMRRGRIRINVVVSEYGGTQGMVSRSSILEEIVGRYACSGKDYNKLRHLRDGRLLGDGRARLRAVEETLGIELSSEAETLAGFIMEQLGRLPKVGDTVAANGCSFKVERTANRVASAVTITPPAEEEASDNSNTTSEVAS